MSTDRPGLEIPKEYRDIATELVDNQGWRYDRNPGGHPVLLPPDRTRPQLRVPPTPTRNPRALKNFIAEVRRRNGVWPPKR